MKVLLDMNLSPLWVSFLAAEGFEATHWSSVGDHRAADVELMSWAREHDHIVLTHDLDFGVLLALTRASGPSVVQVRVQDPLPDAIGRDVVRVLRLRSEVLAKGCLITIDKLKSRVRSLPIVVPLAGDDPE
ncbi:MAG: DUF5615 family PIN-like protein [Deltaproteobacteria bacterium]|nr:DUF5615 family PIN-like protein [Deltaproteobacteria bacterium]